MAALSLLAGCSALEEDKINYKSAAKAQPLEIPPDLTQLRKDSRYAIESTSATASGFASAGQVVKDAGTAANRLGDVRMERSGNQRWLVVDRSADKVWDALREFWTSNGFVLSTDAPDVGIMETDWAENRAKIPQDFIRRTLGKVLDGLYSSGERDRFRTRLERNAAGGVDIYVTHRGMAEEYESTQKQRTIWMPRPSDPELEIEFMRRMMVALGAPKEQAAQAGAPSAAAGSVTAASTVSQWQGQPALLLTDELDRAWRRTGVALDRSGFTVEDRDRSKGLFFVRYVPPTDKPEQGFFAKLFGDKAKGPELTRYQIRVQARSEGGSAVNVLTQTGQSEKSDNAEKILKLLAAQLR
ncbi:MAG: outer membrane protein assembly factor BamC [Pseudomonadota bacterium]|jgi:outer membrane protein assembly factor BamC